MKTVVIRNSLWNPYKVKQTLERRIKDAIAATKPMQVARYMRFFVQEWNNIPNAMIYGYVWSVQCRMLPLSTADVAIRDIH